MEKAIMCPQCNAPLTAHKFARSIVCAHCGSTIKLDESSVSAAQFHQAFRTWNSPATYPTGSSISIGNRHWALDQCIAQGDSSDVYTGHLLRWPTELVIIKILRDAQDADKLKNEWQTLQLLTKSEAPGAVAFSMRLPQPVIHGKVVTGTFTNHWVSIFRWESGFYHTFEDVRKVYPQGIHPQAAIWVWRRILEVLSFIHASGLVHGAILPPHLLVQENEHGVRLVGYSASGNFKKKIESICSGYEDFYPKSVPIGSPLTPQLDLAMSARCMAAILGGNPESAVLPESVPLPLANIIRRTALADSAEKKDQDVWTIREELGRIATDVFGLPQFIPIIMPPHS